MIAVDTNILIYAHREESPFHARAYQAIAQLAEGPAAWVIPWPCIHEFFAIVTHPRIYNPPTPLQQALEQIQAWLEAPTLTLISETDLHWATLRPLAELGCVAGPLIHDARIAALCKQHGIREFWSADRDFGRFPSLRVVNPMIAPLST